MSTENDAKKQDVLADAADWLELLAVAAIGHYRRGEYAAAEKNAS